MGKGYRASGADGLSYVPERFSVPITCSRSAEIRELVGFAALAANVRELRRQAGVSVAAVLRGAREAHLVEFEEDQLDALVKAIGDSMHFTREEAGRKLGKTVVACDGCRVPPGTAGVVGAVEQLPNPEREDRYQVGVQWKVPPVPGQSWFEWFSGDEYGKRVQEPQPKP